MSALTAATESAIKRTEYQEREFTDREAHALTDLTDNNRPRKRPLFPTSSHGSFFWVLYTPALNFKAPNDWVLWKQPRTPSKETTSYPCPNNKWWHHLPQPPAAPLSHHRRCLEVVNITRGSYVCILLYCMNPVVWFTAGVVNLSRNKPFHKNSSQLPFTW